VALKEGCHQCRSIRTARAHQAALANPALHQCQRIGSDHWALCSGVKTRHRVLKPRALDPIRTTQGSETPSRLGFVRAQRSLKMRSRKASKRILMLFTGRPFNAQRHCLTFCPKPVVMVTTYPGGIIPAHIESALPVGAQRGGQRGAHDETT